MEKLAPKRKSYAVLKLFKSGEVVLFDLKNTRTYKLNDAALKMWSLFDGTRSVEDVVNLIANEFDADIETIKKDLIAFVNSLLSLELVGT
jgi:hypothetical protein